MNIYVSEDAAKWYKEEYEVSNASIRLFVRYGGFGGNIPGFSLGVNIEEPYAMHASTEIEGIQFYIEESDSWYFDEKDLHITYSKENKEPQFAYQ